jgi:holliday junction resolvase Hjr
MSVTYIFFAYGDNMSSHRNLKRIGTIAEREILKRLWECGWAAIRSPGSGSAQHPSPDIIAGNCVRRIALECKVSKTDSKYIPKIEIDQLVEFSRLFGAEPWVAVKFKSSGWFFMSIEDLHETQGSYAIKRTDAINKGLKFEELI